jgi:hypothetical protein
MASIARIGIKAAGGGVHQSKTMMLADLRVILELEEDRIRSAVVDENVLGKPSQRARTVALRRLAELYGFGRPDPIWMVLKRLCRMEPTDVSLLALLCALARDPTLRDGAGAVLDAQLGERVGAEAIAAAFESIHPGRLRQRMAASLSRNASSSWRQAGFLRGPVRKERVRPRATPGAAAFAALLASACGFGGLRLLGCRWLDVLDCPPEQRLMLLRQAEGAGLVRVRHVGDVFEIDAIRPMAETLGVPTLVHD